MSPPKLFPSVALGFKADVRRPVQYVSDTVTAYLAGPYMVLTDIESKQQSFMTLINPNEEVGEFAVQTGNSTAAVVVRKDKLASLHMWNLEKRKRRKVLEADPPVSDFLRLNFPPRCGNVVALSNDGEWMLHRWRWGKVNQYVNVKMPNNAIHDMASYAHGSTHLVCLAGDNFVRIYNVNHSHIKVHFQEKTDTRFTGCAWLSDGRLVTTTADHHLILYNHAFESTQNFHWGAVHMNFICPYSSGLIMADAEGSCHVYEIVPSTGDDVLHKTRNFKVAEQPLISGAVRPESAIFTTEDNQILTFDLENNKDDVLVTALATSHMPQKVVSISACQCKQLIALACADKRIILWNYKDHVVEVEYACPSEPLSVSFHPSGLYLVASFPDCIRYFDILVQSLSLFRELSVRNFRIVQFSHGGQYFAAASGQSVIVYNNWSLEPIHSFKLSTETGSAAKDSAGMTTAVSNFLAATTTLIRTTRLEWCKTDHTLLATTSDGHAREFSLLENKMVRQFEPQEGYTVAGALYCDNGRDILLWTSDHQFIEHDEQHGTTRAFAVPLDIAHMHLSRHFKRLNALTSQGEVVSLDLPPNLGPELPSTPALAATKRRAAKSAQRLDYTAWPAHSGNTLDMAVVADESLLVTAGEDGTVVFHETVDHERPYDQMVLQEVLTRQSDLQSQSTVVVELRKQIDMIVADNLAKLKAHSEMYEERHHETSERLKIKLSDLRAVSDELSTTYKANVAAHTAELQSLRSVNTSEKERMLGRHEQDLRKEHEKLVEVQEKMAEWEKMRQGEMAERELSHQRQVDEYNRFFHERMDQISSTMTKLQTEKTASQEVQAARLADVSTDVEQEAAELHLQSEMKLKRERASFDPIRAENLEMRQRAENLVGQIESLKQQVAERASDEKRQHQRIRALQEDLISIKEELAQRNDTLLDKDKRAMDLRKKNQELEKFKFVLDYKILELQKQIEPRQKDVCELQTLIEKMSLEIATYQAHYKELELESRSLSQKLQAMKSSSSVLQEETQAFNVLISRIQRDLKDVHMTTDPKERVRALVRIYHAHTDDRLEGAGAMRASTPSLAQTSGSGARPRPGVSGSSTTVQDDVRVREHMQRTQTVLQIQAEHKERMAKTNQDRLLAQQNMLKSVANRLHHDVQAAQERTTRLEGATQHPELLSSTELHQIDLTLRVGKGKMLTIPSEASPTRPTIPLRS